MIHYKVCWLLTFKVIYCDWAISAGSAIYKFSLWIVRLSWNHSVSWAGSWSTTALDVLVAQIDGIMVGGRTMCEVCLVLYWCISQSIGCCTCDHEYIVLRIYCVDLLGMRLFFFDEFGLFPWWWWLFLFFRQCHIWCVIQKGESNKL